MKLIVQCAMVISWGYYLVLLTFSWGGQLLGYHNDIFEMFDLAAVEAGLPVWLPLLGVIVALFMLVSLGLAYFAIWRILQGGETQDFRLLGKRLRYTGLGLVGFWLGWNIMTGALQALLIAYLPAPAEADFKWDPLDLDIVFPIVGMAVLAISRMMERAWLAEDENRHFL